MVYCHKVMFINRFSRIMLIHCTWLLKLFREYGLLLILSYGTSILEDSAKIVSQQKSPRCPFFVSIHERPNMSKYRVFDQIFQILINVLLIFVGEFVLLDSMGKPSIIAVVASLQFWRKWSLSLFALISWYWTIERAVMKMLLANALMTDSIFYFKVSEYLFLLKSKNTVCFYIKLWKNYIWIFISNFMIFSHKVWYEDFQFWFFFPNLNQFSSL